VWKVSTAGDATSTWWLGTVEAGRAAVHADRRHGTAYFDWSCPDHLDVCDPASWPVYHPAYRRTITADSMQAALDLLGPDEFARAYGNRWVATTARVIPLPAWRAVAAPDMPLPDAGNIAFGFDVAIDRSDAAIVAAWRDGAGVAYLEVAEHRDGAGWLTTRAPELIDRWRPRAFGYGLGGPAPDIADQLERAGVALAPLDGNDWRAACAGLLEAICADPPALRIRPHPALDAAADSAARRASGDAWSWARRQSTVSIATLTAATAALWAYDHSAPAGRFVIL
jgi:hypothetical protein